MRPSLARNKSVRLNPAAVLNLMRLDGQSLQLEYCGTGPRWQLSGGTRVKNAVARIVIANSQVVAGDNALFSNTTPQTWRICK